MHTKTMEGLVGASTNMKQLNTPMRVFKEARRKGDTAKMERAMDYVSDYSGKIDEYQKKADQGMKEEAEELKKKQELECEKAIEKRGEEKKKLEERLEESRNAKTDIVQVSEEGKILLKDAVTSDKQITGTETVKPDIGKEPVIYTETGEVNQTGQGCNISISV